MIKMFAIAQPNTFGVTSTTIKGLTAVSSSEVLDIMFQDFQEQYEELRKHMREKQARELINKQKERKKFELSLSKSDLKEQAIQSAVSWNSQLNRSRSESRRCHLDLQTWTIQYPRSRGSKMTRPTPRLGNYPVALIPGQYADFYKRYTAQELRYWPVNTVLYGPLQPNERHSTGGSDGSQSESEDSSSSDDSSDSSSDGEGEGTCEEEEKGCKACGGKRGGEALVQCSQCGHNSKSSRAPRIALFPINAPHGLS
ncbi:PHD finger protein 10 [Homalodisca vitripennis]|nr:PHD finger protein 10 [Homalodisca vitripennis]